ncbi:hypothetical protein ACFOWM_12465 [Ferruginibacter yonginensis]|uniref:Phytanoyl-CoA dioxygenase n=1 Tax=Ferruginibacter yonginensis TaxID=1310416 RepID=A0ABV8QTZ9_9BACT
MNQQLLFQQFTAYCKPIFDDSLNYGTLKTATEKLHQLFIEIGAINAYEQPINRKLLTNGEALSPQEGALCLFDIARTRTFARGLLQAIQQQKALQVNQPIEVLYAGCGPYGLLSLLVIPYLTEADVQFTLIDIFDSSIQSVKKIVEALGVGSFFKNFIVADATQYIPTQTFDILLTETMQQALKKEPQVAITHHLVHFIKPTGFLLPTQIDVYPVFENTSKRIAALMGNDDYDSNVDSYAHAPIITLNKENALRAQHSKNIYETSIHLHDVAYLKAPYQLQLQTHIHVFANEILTLNNAAITLGFQLMPAADLLGKQAIHFKYVINEMPGVQYCIA